MRRFLNADGLTTTGQGVIGNNMFAYCLNNSTNYVDTNGTLAYPGEIHNRVVAHIANKYGYKKEQFILFSSGGFGRADLVSSSGQIWDVKRNKPRQIDAGKRQVQKYSNGKWVNNPDCTLSVGENLIDYDSFYYKSGLTTYRVTYWYTGDGVVAYDYSVADFDYQTATKVVTIGGVAVVGLLFGLPVVALF